MSLSNRSFLSSGIATIVWKVLVPQLEAKGQHDLTPGEAQPSPDLLLYSPASQAPSGSWSSNLDWTALHSTACTALHSTLLQCTALHCIPCIALHFNALHWTATEVYEIIPQRALKRKSSILFFVRCQEQFQPGRTNRVGKKLLVVLRDTLLECFNHLSA